MGFLVWLREKDSDQLNALLAATCTLFEDPSIRRHYLVALDLFDGDSEAFFHQLAFLNKRHAHLLRPDSVLSAGRLVSLMASFKISAEDALTYMERPHESEQIIAAVVGHPRLGEPTPLMPPEELLEFCTKAKTKVGKVAKAIRAQASVEKKAEKAAEKARKADAKAREKAENLAMREALKANKPSRKARAAAAAGPALDPKESAVSTVNIDDLMKDVLAEAQQGQPLPAPPVTPAATPVPVVAPEAVVAQGPGPAPLPSPGEIVSSVAAAVAPAPLPAPEPVLTPAVPGPTVASDVAQTPAPSFSFTAPPPEDNGSGFATLGGGTGPVGPLEFPQEEQPPAQQEPPPPLEPWRRLWPSPPQQPEPSPRTPVPPRAGEHFRRLGAFLGALGRAEEQTGFISRTLRGAEHFFYAAAQAIEEGDSEPSDQP